MTGTSKPSTTIVDEKAAKKAAKKAEKAAKKAEKAPRKDLDLAYELGYEEKPATDATKALTDMDAIIAKPENANAKVSWPGRKHFENYGIFAEYRAIRAERDAAKWRQEAKSFASGVDNRKVKRLAKLRAQFAQLEQELKAAGVDLEDVDLESLA